MSGPPDHTAGQPFEQHAGNCLLFAGDSADPGQGDANAIAGHAEIHSDRIGRDGLGSLDFLAIGPHRPATAT
jgi:hypothetical protein